jgi:hypothetical protein
MGIDQWPIGMIVGIVASVLFSWALLRSGWRNR